MSRQDHKSFFQDMRNGNKATVTIDGKSYICIPTKGKHFLSRHVPVVVDMSGIPEIAMFRKLQKGGEVGITTDTSKNGILITMLSTGENTKVGVFQIVGYLYDYRSVMISEHKCTIIHQKTYDNLANGIAKAPIEDIDIKPDNKSNIFNKLRNFTEDPFWLDLFAKKIMEDKI